MKLIFTLFALCTFLIAGAQNQTMDLYKLEVAPTIDGDASDWSNIWTGIPLKGSGETGRSTSAMSAKFQIGYDDSYFYMIISVEDDTPYNATGQPWNDDCVEVYVSVDTTDAPIASPYWVQMRYSRDGEARTDLGVDIQVVSASTDKGYVMEWAIPWNGLFESQGKIFTSIDDINYLRFTTQVADNTIPNRTQTNYWNNATGGNRTSRANLGYLKLQGYKPANKTLELHRAGNSPTIDSDFMFDWDFHSWTIIGQTAAASTTFNCDARFQISYDADNFYLVTYVQDDTPFNISGQAWNDDCMEVYVSVDTTDALVVAPYRTQLRISRDGETITDQGINLKVETFSTDDFYIIEMAIPWAGLYESQGKQFTSIDEVTHLRFEVQVADNTDGTNKTQAIYWNNPSGGNSGTRKNYGHLILSENLSTSSNFPELLSVETYYNHIQDALVVSGYTGELKIYNISGQMLKSIYVTDPKSYVNLGGIISGMYIVAGDGFATKFVK